MDRAAFSTLKAALIQMAIERAMKELVLQASFFAYPVVNKLTLKAIEWLVTFIVEKTELGLYFLYTDYVVEKQAAQLIESLKKYREDSSAENEDDLINKFDNLIRIKS